MRVCLINNSSCTVSYRAWDHYAKNHFHIMPLCRMQLRRNAIPIDKINTFHRTERLLCKVRGLNKHYVIGI